MVEDAKSYPSGTGLAGPHLDKKESVWFKSLSFFSANS